MHKKGLYFFAHSAHGRNYVNENDTRKHTSVDVNSSSSTILDNHMYSDIYCNVFIVDE